MTMEITIPYMDALAFCCFLESESRFVRHAVPESGGPGKTRSFMVCGPPWLGVDWNRLSIDWTPSKRRLPRGVIAWRSVRCSLNELCTGEVTKLKTPFHNLVGEDIARNG